MLLTDPVAIDAVDPLHPHALLLLGEAALEARALYPELFATDTPAPTNLPLRPRECYLVARRDGRVVGCGALRRLDEVTGEVHRMFVTRAARRAGVARALLGALESHAHAFGYRRLVLETGARQRPAIALYRSAGWRRIAAYGPHAGDPGCACFGKALP